VKYHKAFEKLSKVYHDRKVEEQRFKHSGHSVTLNKPQ